MYIYAVVVSVVDVALLCITFQIVPQKDPMAD